MVDPETRVLLADLLDPLGRASLVRRLRSDGWMAALGRATVG